MSYEYEAPAAFPPLTPGALQEIADTLRASGHTVEQRGDDILAIQCPQRLVSGWEDATLTFKTDSVLLTVHGGTGAQRDGLVLTLESALDPLPVGDFVDI